MGFASDNDCAEFGGGGGERTALQLAYGTGSPLEADRDGSKTCAANPKAGSHSTEC